jgi:hypothetical protein
LIISAIELHLELVMIAGAGPGRDVIPLEWPVGIRRERGDFEALGRSAGRGRPGLPVIKEN